MVKWASSFFPCPWGLGNIEEIRHVSKTVGVSIGHVLCSANIDADGVDAFNSLLIIDIGVEWGFFFFFFPSNHPV